LSAEKALAFSMGLVAKVLFAFIDRVVDHCCEFAIGQVFVAGRA